MSWIHKSLIIVALAAGGWSYGSSAKPAEPQSQPSVTAQEVNQDWMLEGEKRYRANCGRCHQPPRKFTPREMATIVRHMRVRAMLTEDDMRYLLYYMTH